MKHNFTRRYLNIEQDVQLDYESVNKRVSNLITKAKKQNQTTGDEPPNGNSFSHIII